MQYVDRASVGHERNKYIEESTTSKEQDFSTRASYPRNTIAIMQGSSPPQSLPFLPTFPT